MRLLLLSQDEGTVDALSRLLQEAGIDVVHQSDPQVAVEQVVLEKFDGVMVDSDDPPGAALVLRALREMPAATTRLAIVLATAQTGVYWGFSSGAHIALYKPVSPERVSVAVGAIRNLLARERRRGVERVPLGIAANLGTDGTTRLVIVVDLSEGGAAILCHQPIPSSGLLTFHCWLPEIDRPFIAKAETVWQDAEGRSGIRFVSIASDSDRVLGQWLQARSLSESEARRS